MSNIPRARDVLHTALQQPLSERMLRAAIKLALVDMTREKPKFRHDIECPPLTAEQRRQVRRLRARGLSVNAIARRFGTNNGRVSECINFKAAAERDR